MATNANDSQHGQLRFGCTAKELKELMETRGVDAVNRLKHKYGTVDELCRRLHVSPNEGKLTCVYLLNNKLQQQNFSHGRFYVGAGALAPQIHLLPPRFKS